MRDDSISVVRFMREKDHRGIGFGGDGKVKVRVTGAGVFQTAEPEAGATLLDGDVLVDQDWGAVAPESVADHGGVYGDVVVAQDGITKGSGEASYDLGAAVNGVIAGYKGERAVGDEVSGEENEIGGKSVDLFDEVLEKVGFGVFVEMDVADLHDAIAVKGVR